MIAWEFFQQLEIPEKWRARWLERGKEKPQRIVTATTLLPLVCRNGARWFKKAKKLRSDMVGVADEFGRQLFNELDYVKEAYNCIRFKVCATFIGCQACFPRRVCDRN